jgi:WD40 repeat protein
MVWSQDDSHVLTWGRDGAARIWSVSELLHAQARFKHDTGFLDAALSPGRPEVAIVDAEGNVRLEGTANSRPRLLNQAGAIWAGFVGDRRIASLGEDDRLSLWDLTTGKLSARIGGASGSVFIGPAADAILTWDFGGPAKWWATDSKSRVLKPLRGAFDGVACDDQSPFFASWDYEGVLMIWDWGTGRRMMSIDVGPGVGTVALSSDGKRVACGGREGRIEIWSATEKRKPRRIVHPSYVSQMAFSSSGRLLATIAEDKFVRVLEIDADKSRVAQFRRTRGSVVRVRFTNDEKRLLLQSRTWIHLLAIQDGLVPLSSLRMSGRIVDVAVLSDDGSKLSVLTRPWPGAYHLDEIDLLKYPIGEPDGHVAKLKQRVLASSGLVFQNEVLVQQPFTVSLKPRRASGAKSRARISGVAVGDFRARRIGPRRSTRSE